jgi:DNA-binding NarL/FixJ family response regulator
MEESQMFEESISSPPGRFSFGSHATPAAQDHRTGTKYEPPQPPQPPQADEALGATLSSLGDVLDMFEQGVVMVRSDLHPCYHNRAAHALLDADSQRDVLAREVRAVSGIALSERNDETTVREVGTIAGFYRLRAQLLKKKLIDITSRTVLVTIERAEARTPSPEFLMRRFSMTEREAAVAVLLARGARNAEIASDLRISTHTARHHTESVLSKLNVHTRAEAARAIVAGLPAGLSTHTGRDPALR